MVVSQKHIAVIDPHRKCIKPKSETSPAGTKKKLSTFFRYSGHVSTFESIFNLNTRSKNYAGTIFRFPLRRSDSESDISTKVYTPQKIKEKLFESLKEESPYILLFLRSVKSISLMEWTKGSSQPHETFKVAADDQAVVDQGEPAVAKCEAFARQCSQNSDTDNSEIYVELKSNTVTVMNYSDISSPESLSEIQHNWLVLKVVGTNDSELAKLGEELSILPWVGLATRLPCQVSLCSCETTTTRPFDESSTVEKIHKKLHTSLEYSQLSLKWSEESVGSQTGHAYCFLPLPESTAMPVHVHGYFAVTDNRRSIKWPAHDEKGKEAQWNKELLEKMVAPAYALLLACCSSITKYIDTPLPLVNSDNVIAAYSSWPRYLEVKNVPIWNELVSPTLALALPLPLFWTQACGGKWVQLSEAYFLPGSYSASYHPCSSVVTRMLINEGISVVSVSKDICETLKQNKQALEILSHNEISPKLVRETIIRSSNSCCSSMSSEEVYEMLDYILSDLTVTNYHSLTDICLLPLKEASKVIKFEKPSGYNHKYIFPPQSKTLLEIIPGADDMIVDPKIPETISKKLCEISSTQCLQIRLVNTEALCKHLLHKSICSWCTQKSGAGWRWVPGQSSMPPPSWIDALWKWIASSNVSLSTLVGLPIIPQLPFETPEQRESEVILLEVSKTQKLCRVSPTLLSHEKSVIMDIMKKLGFLVVDVSRMGNNELPTDIEEFIPELTSNLELVIKYLSGLQSSQFHILVQMLSFREKDFLREHVYGSRDLCGKYIKCLKLLPIYPAASSNETSPHYIPLHNINGSEVAFLPPDDLPPLPDYPSNMLCPVKFHNEKLFLEALNVKQLTLSDLCKDHLIPLALYHIRNDTHSWSVGDDLILYILKQRQQIGKKTLLSLSKYKIVYTHNCTHKKPQDIVDPHDENITILFDVVMDKDCFPVDQYFNDANSCNALASMGMKTWKHYQSNHDRMCDLLCDRMNSVKFLHADSSTRFNRGQFILQKLTELDRTKLKINKHLNQIQFLMCEGCPLSYPSNLKDLWFGHDVTRLYSVDELCIPDSRFHNLVGTVKPILSQKYSYGQYAVSVSACQKLLFLRITEEAVIEHLKKIQSAAVCHENIDSLDHVIMSVYDYLFVASKGQRLSLVWQKDGKAAEFIPASRFILDLPEGLQANLEPFYHHLQAPIRKYAHIFQLHVPLSPVDVALVLKQLGERVLTKPQSRLCISILNWLCEKQYKESAMLMLTKNDTLVSARKCVYDDRNWMKHSKSRGHIKFKKSLIFVHEQIPQSVARHFAVEPLSCKVAPSQKLGISYTKAGQHEDITQRIRHIVQDYETNIDIFKELIQNADDAGATEVKFLIDWRHHPKESLIAEELKEWQGPALIAYNNATFSDEDFKSICTVAAETKRKDPLKTGRFGVGFCATYHLTDLPSFISRRFFTMFDPHISYLGDRISSNEPGMRVDLVENKDDLELYHDQFVPYDSIFGCSVFDLNGDGYNGTMFRFPFRSEHTSKSSRICKKIYDRNCMFALVQELKRQCSELLLFLKHVTSVSLFELEKDAADPCMPCEIFSIQRSGLSAERIKVIKSYSAKPLRQDTEMLCTSKFDIVTKECGKECSKTYWMISTAIKKPSSAMQSHPEATGLLPLAEVAIKLEPSPEQFKFIPNVSSGVKKVFCFLPLPIDIHLPFHVNGFFSIGKDRRNISSTDDKTFGPLWNKSLAEGALVTAYVHLLQTLCNECDLGYVSSPKIKEEYVDRYYSLLNIKEETSKDLISSSFVAGLKECISTLKCSILWSEVHGGCWLSPLQAELFDDKRLNTGSERDRVIRKDAISLFLKHGHGIVEIPHNVYKLVKSSIISGHRFHDYKNFGVKLFFPNIESIEKTVRDRNIMFLVEKVGAYQGENSWYEWAEQLLSKQPCIQCQNSSSLRPASKLIDPTNPLFKKMFNVNEGRFPNENLQKSSFAMQGLIKLGMASTRLSILDLKERAKSVISLEHEEAVKRSQYICEYIDSVYSYQLYTTIRKSRFSEELEELSTIPFLPVKQKSFDVDVPWDGMGKLFASPSQLYASEYEHLIFSQHPVVVLSSQKALHGLGICSKEPTPKIVIAHLQCIISHIKDKPNEATVKFLDECMKYIYRYFCTHLNSPTVLKELLQLDKFIWQDGYFLGPSQVVCRWSHKCIPYMTELSHTNSDNTFLHLLKTLGVKEEADHEMMIDILKRIAVDHGDHTPISDNILEFIVFLTGKLCRKLQFQASSVANDHTIYLPDEKKIMRTVSNLADNIGSEWIKSLPVYQEFINSESGYFVHSSIPRERATKLGVNPLLEAVLKDIEDEDFLTGTDFGQSEDLCDRLNGILRKYPADISIFKEFIQNADDAQASEIAFVLDRRVDFPDSSLFSSSPKWKSLQHTPALCIFNNRKFTENDIEGITKLGRGGKYGSSELIGKFGIGFNVAYHVTDCPSFVSYSESGAPEYLCVFDPTQSFAPHATKKSPGRKWNFKDKHHYSGFSDQFQPYLPNDIHKFSGYGGCLQDYKDYGYVIFRLPLTRIGRIIGSSYVPPSAKLKSGSILDLGDIANLYGEFDTISQDMLLFLNHIKRVSAFEILKDGTCVHHFTTVASIPANYLQMYNQFSLSLKQYLKTIQAGNQFSRVSIPHLVDITQTKPDSDEKKTQWLVQRVIDGSKHQLPLLKAGLSQGLRPFAGVATRWMPESSDYSYLLFCFLPLPIQSNLPVHVNAQFLLDDSRKHLESIAHSGLDKWNETIAQTVVVSAYLDLIKTVKGMLFDINNSCEFYYSLFPRRPSIHGLRDAKDSEVKVGEMQDLNIVNTFYRALLQQNPPLLIRLMSNSTFPWMNMKDALFCVPFICQTTDRLFTVSEKLKGALASLELPITNAPDYIYHQCEVVDDSITARVCPEKIIKHLEMQASCIAIRQEQKEVIKNNLYQLLHYCISGYSQSAIPNLFKKALFLLAKDGSLQRNYLFESKFSHLLPHCQKHFTCPLLERTGVGQILLNCNVIRPLPPDFVSDNILLPTTGAICDLHDSSLDIVTHLWEYLTNLSMQRLFDVPSVLINHFAQKAIVPTGDDKMYPINLSKALVRATCSCENCNVMKKLNYSQIDFGKIKVSAETYFLLNSIMTNLTSCFKAGSDILDCFELQPPKVLDVELTEEEVFSFTTSLGKVKASRLKKFSQYFQRMPLFHTIDESRISLFGVTRVFLLETSNLPLEGIPVSHHGQVVLKAATSDSVKNFYRGVIPSNISAVDAEEFYSEWILPILPELEEDNIKIHLDFLYLQRKKMSVASSKLMEIPFIEHKGQMHKVSDFYDPTVPFFTLFMTDSVLPTTWHDKLDILKWLDLKTEVTTTDWLQRALEFSFGATNDVLAELKSSVLLQELNNLIIRLKPFGFGLSDFLFQVANIQFLYSPQKSTELNELLSDMFPNDHKPPSHYMIKFKESVPLSESNLACLCKSVLPRSCQSFIVHSEYLGIEDPPSPETVVKNLMKLCRSISTSFARFQSHSLARNVLLKNLINIFEEHYSYLAARNLSTGLLIKLKYFRCILRSKSALLQLLTPTQLVMQLPSDCSLEPYCFKVDPWLQKYADLLSALGTKQELKAQDYIHILATVKEEHEDDKDNIPKKVIESAYKELICRLRRGDSMDIQSENDSVIYLPDKDLNLSIISELCLDDVPWYKNRLPLQFSLKMILEPPSDHKGHRTLPECLNVQRLSDIVVEELDESCKSSDFVCNDEELYSSGKRPESGRCLFVKCIIETLKSDELFYGFCRMYYTEYRSPPPGQFKVLVKNLKQVKVHCVNGELKTLLSYKGQPITGTEDTSKLCHVCCSGRQFTLYIAPHSELLGEGDLSLFFKDLAVCISKLIDNEIKNTGPIAAIFECSPNEIPQTLTREHIFEYSQDDAPSAKAITIGTHIPWSRLDPKESLVVMNFDPEDPVRCVCEDGSLINAEVVTFREGQSGILDSAVTIKIKEVEDSAENCDHLIDVSPLRIFKVLTGPQKRSLWTGTTSPYASPLSLETVPINESDEDKLELWWNEALKPYSGLLQAVLALRLIGHMHYQATLQKKSSSLIAEAMEKSLLQYHFDLTNWRVNLVVDLIKSTIKKIASQAFEAVFPSIDLARIMESKESSISMKFGHSLHHDVHNLHTSYPSSIGPYSHIGSAASYPGGGVSTISPYHPTSVSQTAQSTHQASVGVSGSPWGSQLQAAAGHSRYGAPKSRRSRRSRGYGYQRFHRFKATECSTPPKPDICVQSATAWLEQAKADYNAASLLLLGSSALLEGEIPRDINTRECRFPALVCFLCHDIVEKCIKGVFYTFCGLSQDLVNCSNIVTLHEALVSSPHHPKQLKTCMEECVMTVSRHESRSRFPNYQNPPCSPASIYDVEDAEEAFRAVLKLLHMLQKEEILTAVLNDLGQLPTKRFMSVLQSRQSDQGKLCI